MSFAAPNVVASSINGNPEGEITVALVQLSPEKTAADLVAACELNNHWLTNKRIRMAENRNSGRTSNLSLTFIKSLHKFFLTGAEGGMDTPRRRSGL